MNGHKCYLHEKRWRNSTRLTDQQHQLPICYGTFCRKHIAYFYLPSCMHRKLECYTHVTLWWIFEDTASKEFLSITLSALVLNNATFWDIKDNSIQKLCRCSNILKKGPWHRWAVLLLYTRFSYKLRSEQKYPVINERYSFLFILWLCIEIDKAEIIIKLK